MRIAYFVTAHGFGHAARASAVMDAIWAINPSAGFDIFTETPRWFFSESLKNDFSYHNVKTDVGLVQESSMVEDIPATIIELGKFFPLKERRLEKIIKTIIQTKSELIISDISPLGLKVGALVDIPSILIENFTWDWIYDGYSKSDNGFKDHILYLTGLFNLAKYQIQTHPICNKKDEADLFSNPVARKQRITKKKVRELLNIGSDDRMVLITSGGIEHRFESIADLKEKTDCIFVILGGAVLEDRQENVIFLPHHSRFYHPDLVFASDLVIGKTGYSTVAEVFYTGIPYGYINRPRFRESRVLSDFILNNMDGIEISNDDFCKGNWVKLLDELLSYGNKDRNLINGADQIAQFISDIF